MTETKEKVILVGLNSQDERSDDATMDELEALVETYGGEAAVRVIQNRPNPDKKYFIGEGKAEEIAQICKNMEITQAVFDNDLSPSQTRALEDILNIGVTDRSLLILNIFSNRAQSREGRVQSELARLKYVLPRLTGKGTEMSRLGGGGGGSGGARRGAGEQKLEITKRHIRGGIKKLSDELSDIRRIRQENRRKRLKSDIPRVSLIGYTNAGKSTLLNVLCKEKIKANNRLFDTLDTTTRRLSLQNGKTVLLSDTVGFIRKLPHHLVEAFRSTLEELNYAHLLLHVIDISHPEWEEQAEVVEGLIRDLGAEEIPCLRVYNKSDLLDKEFLPAGLCISASKGIGIPELREAIEKALI